MPIFDDSDGTTQLQTPSGFKFSAAKLDLLTSSKYTLCNFALDVSGSVQAYEGNLKQCLKDVLRGCRDDCATSDNLLVRVVTFATDVQEVHGFRPVAKCKDDDYERAINTGGWTALFKASVNSIEAMSAQGRELIAGDYYANGIFVCVTDGQNNIEGFGAKEVALAVARAKESECLESVLTILVGVGAGSQDGKLDKYLSDFKTNAGFDQYIALEDTTQKSFSKLSGFLQQSVSSQSQKVGTGQASQAIVY